MSNEILVIGESCRDIFVYCDCARLCPDVPVPVLKIINQSDNAGMAKNVQRNIQSLNIHCSIVTNEDWYNVTKTRYVHDNTNHMFFRVDTDHNIPRINLDKISYDYRIIVISDYNKGFLTEEDIKIICSRHPNVFVDTKKQLGDWADKARYIKINNFEYEKSKPGLTSHLESKIIHTKGGEGCFFNNKNYKVDKVEVRDTSGCGDTFLAGLVVEYHKSGDIERSIIFANQCASEVAKHRGVTTVNIESNFHD
jgi:bifunctional ADP-heptose synthase (sugar kinase/adenylyltransferase)